MESLNTNKVVNATKWSAITEVVAKLVTPVTSMVLARLLTPEAFGIVATVTMIISFAEIFTDAGFQKYLIQHEFIDDTDKDQSINVAFWSNLMLSLIMWALIAVFNSAIARIVGNPGLGYVIVIASISIPLEAFSSIQMALFKRDFEFKTLFKARLVGLCVPLFITIPLAVLLKNYWALIIGTIVANFANAIILTVFSKWKPRMYYSWNKFREMFSFTVWSMIEAISIWLTSYIDIFIVGVYLSQHFLGLYKNSMNIVASITAIVTSATTPVLFSSLSRLQDNRSEFEMLFFKFQNLVAILILPLGVGIFCFRDLITSILLGSQWMEAANFIGMWGLTSSITIVLAHYCSEVYRALGKPKLSVVAQWLHIIVLWPVVLFYVKDGFDVLCIARSIVRLELVLVQLIVMYFAVKISPLKMVMNITHPIAGSILIWLVAELLLPVNNSIWWSLTVALICGSCYVVFMCCYKKERDAISAFIIRLMARK